MRTQPSVLKRIDKLAIYTYVMLSLMFVFLFSILFYFATNFTANLARESENEVTVYDYFTLSSKAYGSRFGYEIDGAIQNNTGTGKNITLCITLKPSPFSDSKAERIELRDIRLVADERQDIRYSFESHSQFSSIDSITVKSGENEYYIMGTPIDGKPAWVLFAISMTALLCAIPGLFMVIAENGRIKSQRVAQAAEIVRLKRQTPPPAAQGSNAVFAANDTPFDELNVPAKARFCPSCGHPFVETDDFCSACGKKR